MSAALADVAPNLALEWDYESNSALLPGVTPENASPGWRRSVFWICTLDSTHGRWRAGIRARVRGEASCPFCFEAPRSDIEIGLASELIRSFAFDPSQHKVRLPEGGALDVDILIPRPFGKADLIVEYDGSHWHKCVDGCRHRIRCRHNRDRSKSLTLQRLGFVVVRVREEPLDVDCRMRKHHRRDVYVAAGARPAAIAERLIDHLQQVYANLRLRPPRTDETNGGA